MAEQSELETISRIRKVYYTTYAAFPATGVMPGDLAYATDRKTLYRWSGAAWQAVTIYSASGVLADRPAANILPAGSIYYATDVPAVYQGDGANWTAVSSAAFKSLSDVLFVAKTADEQVNNSAVLQNDNHLLLAVAANSKYLIILIPVFDSSVGADFKWAFTAPAGATLMSFSISEVAGAAHLYNSASAVSDGQGVASYFSAVIFGILITGANAGNIQFQWAQNAAEATNTTVRNGSVMLGIKQ